ncbi:permease [Candidatus Aerophobetes bacterium]|nr:permease [Candidatus Aerophobetes bacterium]
MSLTAVFINVFALSCLFFAVFKNKEKTKKSLIVAAKSLLRILPVVLIIVILIGLLLGFIPPEKISQFIGEQSGLIGIVIIAMVGAVLHIPALVSFPLAASLLKSGASISAVAAFITTLTMIGTVTLPLEIKELGKKMAFLRNGISFVIAIVIALIMGAVL